MSHDGFPIITLDVVVSPSTCKFGFPCVCVPYNHCCLSVQSLADMKAAHCNLVATTVRCLFSCNLDSYAEMAVT